MLHQAAVGGHDLQRQHVLAHRAVAHRVGARGARARHAADRGVGAGIDREEQAGGAEIFVELLARDAGLHDDVEVGLVDLQHLVHAAEIERDAAVGRADMAFERGAGAERDDRRLVRGAELDDLLHLLGRFGEHDGVGQVRLVIRNVLAVLLAHGVGGGEPVAVKPLQLGDGAVDLRGSCLGRDGHVGSPSVGRWDTLKCRQSQPRETLQNARRLYDRRLYDGLQEAPWPELRRPRAGGLYGVAEGRRHEDRRRYRVGLARQLRHGLLGPELDPRPGAVPAAGRGGAVSRAGADVQRRECLRHGLDRLHGRLEGRAGRHARAFVLHRRRKAFQPRRAGAHRGAVQPGLHHQPARPAGRGDGPGRQAGRLEVQAGPRPHHLHGHLRHAGQVAHVEVRHDAGADRGRRGQEPQLRRAERQGAVPLPDDDAVGAARIGRCPIR